MAVISTWNLENLYLPGGPYGPPDKAVYDAKLDAVAGVIAQLRPDVLGVQEVGDPEALADLAARLGTGWHTELSSHPDGRGIRVGFLSRGPLTVLADTDVFPGPLHAVQTLDSGPDTSTLSRGALAVRALPAPDRPLDLAVCHLKSKLLSYPGGRFAPRDEGERARYGAYALFRRAAEAASLRALADRLLAGDGRTRDVVVLGDLNDVPTAATTQILYGPPGSELGTAGFDRPDKGDAHRLWNLAARIPAERRYSRVSHGNRELIDHILVSHALVGRVEWVSAGAGGSAAPPPSVGDDPRAARAVVRASDHLPVVAEVR